MEVTENLNAEIHVTYFSAHYGHSFDVAHSLLSAEEKSSIAGKLAEGVPLQTVLDHIRNAATGDLARIHIVTKLDLHNIMASFNINHSERLHQNDKVSVQYWVEEMRNKVSNPVIYFKQQGLPDELGELRQEDFMIVLMTEPQRGLLKRLGTEKICIDSTHGTNLYDFQLTTLVVIDEFGSSFPCAYCISNKVDTIFMSSFFRALKNVIGLLECKVFMSDDASAYYNAWECVMGKVEKRLLCTWHVDKNWRQNIQKLIPGKELKALVYKTVRTLLEETDTLKFEKLLSAFLEEMNEPDTFLFRNYFHNHYAQRSEVWAYCHRIYIGINTNMYLEGLHRVIKYCYLEGRVNKRLDKLITALLKLTRDKLFDRLIKLCKGKVTQKIATIHKKHQLGKLIPAIAICSTEAGRMWRVKSQSLQNTWYHVLKNENSNQCDCKLTCKSCNTCIHTYACSCTDHVVNFNMCKHIHAVISMSEDTKIIQDQDIVAEKQESEPSADDPQDLLQDIQDFTSSVAHEVRHNPKQTTVIQMTESLLVQLKTTEFDVTQLKTMEDSLSKLLNVAQQKNQGNSIKLNTPHNKQIEKQRRYFSTKRQRVKQNTCDTLTKPTELQKDNIEEMLLNPSSSIVNIHSDFDHTY